MTKGMTGKRHKDITRERIRTAYLINRLQSHIEGKANMSESQVKAAKILLDKSLSNAPTVQQHSGAVEVICTLKSSALDG